MTNFVAAQIKLQTKEAKPLKDIPLLASQSGKAKGWRAREMGLSKRNDVNFRECFRHDLAELKGFVLAVPDASKHNNHHSEGTWKAQTQQFNPHTIKYLQYTWGVGRKFASNDAWGVGRNSLTNKQAVGSDAVSKCVIENRKVAKATTMTLYGEANSKETKGD
jgi:hypothetical protein